MWGGGGVGGAPCGGECIWVAVVAVCVCVCVSVKKGVIRVKSEITSFLGLWVRATSSERHCLFVYGRCEILQTLACPGVPTLFER